MISCEVIYNCFLFSIMNNHYIDHYILKETYIELKYDC